MDHGRDPREGNFFLTGLIVTVVVGCVSIDV